MNPFAGMRIEVVADDDALAHPLIPKDVLAALGQDGVLTNGTMMYVRESLWLRIKEKVGERTGA